MMFNECWFLKIVHYESEFYMITRICLIRHGETDWNAQKRCQGREVIELNAKGKIQAAIIARE